MSLEQAPWPLRTARLLIRPARAEDAAALWPYRSDPVTAQWLTRCPTDQAAFATWLASPDVLGKTLVMEVDGEVVGDLFLHVQDAWSQHEVSDGARGVDAEIGWALAPGHRGRGYAREGVTALLGVCFDVLGLHRVVAGCFAANEPSWRLMEAVGMRRECSSRRDALHRDLGWLDGFQYALLDDEWAALGAGG